MNLIADIGIKKIESMLPLLSGFEDINIKYLDTESINSKSIIETNILLIRSQTIVDESLLLKSKIDFSLLSPMKRIKSFRLSKS